VAEGILKSVESLRNEGTKPTFNAILAYLRSRRTLSNHESLRAYLDSLVLSGLLNVRTEPASQPNIRPRQVYSFTHDGPFVEAGEKALIFHGLNWTLPAKSSVKLKTDVEGVVRGRLEGATLYASLEDTVVENLASINGKAEADRMLSFCAALLATKKFDHAYLMQRARERGVEELMQELLDEIEYLFTSPRAEVEDIKSLYAIRRWFQSVHRITPARSPKPQWSLLSPDELVDVIGKQLGLK
jgi:hypothetical protein